jgi:hypothetical protein
MSVLLEADLDTRCSALVILITLLQHMLVGFSSRSVRTTFDCAGSA